MTSLTSLTSLSHQPLWDETKQAHNTSNNAPQSHVSSLLSAHITWCAHVCEYVSILPPTLPTVPPDLQGIDLRVRSVGLQLINVKSKLAKLNTMWAVNGEQRVGVGGHCQC